MQGVPRLIEDISQESGSVLVTVVGYHNLTVFTKTQSIPVKLTGTGHFLLDSCSFCSALQCFAVLGSPL